MSNPFDDNNEELRLLSNANNNRDDDDKQQSNNDEGGISLPNILHQPVIATTTTPSVPTISTTHSSTTESNTSNDSNEAIITRDEERLEEGRISENQPAYDDDEGGKEEGGEDDEGEEEEEEEEDLFSVPEKYSASVLSLLKPVSLAMLIVVWATKTFAPLLQSLMEGSGASASGGLIYNESEDDSVWIKFGGAILNALMIVVVVVVTTVILVILYKYRCMKLIYGWLIGTSALLLFAMGGMWLYFIIEAYHIPMDLLTFLFILWNFAVVGVISIFWRGHRIMTQAYLIAVSCMTAWWLTRLPEWTSWAILAAVAIYDIVAVLMPKGPLKVLVETAQQRNEPIPGLVYESTTFKLGLGDFVFYSVLVGRAAMYDFATFAACFICILTGLCLTLFCLGLFRKALPALPISIALGIASYFLTRFCVFPYVLQLGLHQVVA